MDINDMLNMSDEEFDKYIDINVKSHDDEDDFIESFYIDLGGEG